MASKTFILRLNVVCKSSKFLYCLQNWIGILKSRYSIHFCCDFRMFHLLSNSQSWLLLEEFFWQWQKKTHDVLHRFLESIDAQNFLTCWKWNVASSWWCIKEKPHFLCNVNTQGHFARQNIVIRGWQASSFFCTKMRASQEVYVPTTSWWMHNGPPSEIREVRLCRTLCNR